MISIDSGKRPAMAALNLYLYFYALIAVTGAKKEITIGEISCSICFDAFLLHNDFHRVRTMRVFSQFAGAIFDENSEEAQIAFKYAVIRENMYDGKFELVPVIKTIQSTESYGAEQAGEYRHEYGLHEPAVSNDNKNARQ